jgi:hypothetical protein
LEERESGARVRRILTKRAAGDSEEGEQDKNEASGQSGEWSSDSDF